MKDLPYDTPGNNEANLRLLAKTVGIPERMVPKDENPNKTVQVLAGVILYRHLELQNQREVMNLIGSYSSSHREFYGALHNKIASILAHPEWEVWSLSNEELEEIIYYYSKFSEITGFTGVASSSGLYGIAKSAWNSAKSSKGNVVALVTAVVCFGMAQVANGKVEGASSELESRKITTDRNSTFPGR